MQVFWPEKSRVFSVHPGAYDFSGLPGIDFKRLLIKKWPTNQFLTLFQKITIFFTNFDICFLNITINIYFLLSVAVVFITIPAQIVGLFTDDQNVIKYGVDCLRYISYGNGFFALGVILVQAFNGAGDI